MAFVQNDLVDRCYNFCLHTALPLWASNGFDEQFGTFYECLQFDGSPIIDAKKRFRTQIRQVYVYSLAAHLGLGKYWLAEAEKAVPAIVDNYHVSDGSWYALTDREGRILDDTRGLYDAAFAVMGFGMLAHVSNNPAYEELTNQSWDFVAKVLPHKRGGFRMSEPDRAPLPRQQNPHMHMFEACLSQYKITGNKKWLERADIFYGLFKRYFFDQKNGCLIEFFDDDLQPHGQTGNRLDPGHHYEWVWLLLQYKKLCNKRTIKSCEQLFCYANSYGTDGTTLAVDEIKLGGQTLRDTKRLWVQCEVLKAHLAIYEITAEKKILPRINQHLQLLLTHYLREDTGTWYDQVDSNNHNVSANAPASTWYHLLLAFTELLRIVGYKTRPISSSV